MIELHLPFGLLKRNLMDILFPSFCSWKHAFLVIVDFYDFCSSWATTHLSLLNTSVLALDHQSLSDLDLTPAMICRMCAASWWKHPLSILLSSIYLANIARQEILVFYQLKIE